jgi:hypothetical protein
MSSSNAPPRDDADATGEDGTEADADADVEIRAVCPFCGSEDTELHSTFGSEVSKSQFYCHGCHTVFERIKYDGATPPTGRGRDGKR